MAKQLIESMSVTWNPSTFKDEYHAMLEKVVEMKVKYKGGKEKAGPEKKVKATNVIDLASILQASIKQAQTKKSPGTKRLSESSLTDMSLKPEYNRKRSNFGQTEEPAGKAIAKGRTHRFVIQKHAASRLHYDFRLEMGGTLKSWAVPKGMPYAKGEKRLAVEVEDHPVSYINFEGTIPKGQYGGGTVMVWDRGTYEPLSANPAKDLSGGKLHFILHGEKLEGEWYLVRLRDEKNWLLVRGHDDMKPVSAKMDDTSAVSGRNMEAISKSKKVWNSKPPAKAPLETKHARAKALAAFPQIRRTNESATCRACAVRRLALRDQAGWVSARWLFKNGNSVRLLSRNGNDFGEKFPGILEAVKELSIEDAIIDGEIVALDPKGRAHPFNYFIAMIWDGKNHRYSFTHSISCDSRERICKKIAADREKKHFEKRTQGGYFDLIRYSSSLDGDVKRLLIEAQRLGLEGLICKRADSLYEAGKRSGAWVKVKLHHEQEMVIGGFTDPEGSRTQFGSLIVGYYDKGQPCGWQSWNGLQRRAS